MMQRRRGLAIAPGTLLCVVSVTGHAQSLPLQVVAPTERGGIHHPFVDAYESAQCLLHGDHADLGESAALATMLHKAILWAVRR